MRPWPARSTDELLDGLRSWDSWLRAEAASALGRREAREAVAPLVEALADVNWRVRRAAAGALGRLRDPVAVVPLLRMLSDPQGDLREAASHALGDLGGDRAFNGLVGALHDPSGPVRRATIDALSRFGQPAAPALIDALGDGNPRSRRAAANALVGLGHGSLAAGVLQAQEGNPEPLLRLGDPRAVPPLLRALEHCDGEVQVAVVDVLACMGEDAVAQTVRRLVSLLGGRPSPVAALMHLGAPAVEPLAAALLEAGEPARLGAARVLGGLGDARSVRPLARALDDPSGEVRRVAAEALGDLGALAVEAVPALRAVSQEDNLWWLCNEAAARIEAALRRSAQSAPAEMIAASEPVGTGTEPEAADAPAGRGTEPEAAGGA